MRLRALGAALTLLLGIPAQGQVWEKLLVPGLTYRMEVDASIPRIVHAYRLSLDASTKAEPELGGLKVYSETEGEGRETLGDLVKRTGAVAGINGDFFPFTGDPLGLMVRRGEMVSRPMPSRAAFGWGSRSARGALPRGDLTLTVDHGSFKLDGLNQACGVNELVLNLEAAGNAVGEKGPVVHAIVSLHGTVRGGPTGTIRGHLLEVRKDVPQVPVAPGTAIITASGSRTTILNRMAPGEEVRVKFETGGFDWSQIEHVIGGGPFLIRNGKVHVDWEKQGFKPDFALKRHPRTAIGVTDGGDLWFVTIDGRQAISDGATLDEAADLMLRLGCREAVNLDGGGSTTINAGGITLNRPSDGKQRPIANAVLFFGSKTQDPAVLSLAVPESIPVGSKLQAVVHDEKGRAVPNHEIVWAAQGKAWIDQGGLVRTLGDGEAWIFAYVRGRVLSAQVAVKAG